VVVKTGIDMSEQAYRTIGAVVGLGIGYGLMTASGFAGMVALALFSGGGCVLGGMVAERVFRWSQNQGR